MQNLGEAPQALPIDLAETQSSRVSGGSPAWEAGNQVALQGTEEALKKT